MEFLQYIDHESASSPTMADNNTCDENKLDYIPTVAEYREALGGLSTALITFGSVSTVLFYGLFFQQAWFIYCNSHKVYRLHIYWLLSIVPLMFLLTTVAIVIPRTHEMCSALKIVYMSMGVGHFVDLTLLMYGSEEKMLYDLRDSPIHLNQLPLCCCCPCIPSLTTTKLRLKVLRWMIWQVWWIQAFSFILLYVVKTTLQHPDGTMDPGPWFSWFGTSLSLFNITSFLSGSWAINIIEALSVVKLKRFRYFAKSWAVKGLTITIKLQVVVFEVLAIFKVFPCLGPNFTPIVYLNTVENSIQFIQLFVIGLFSYYLYRLPEFKEYEQPLIPTTQDKEVDNSADATDIQAITVDAGSSGSESAYGSTDSMGNTRQGAQARRTGAKGGGQMPV